MYFHQVFPHCFLKTERKITDQNYCTFEDRCWPNRRQWKISSTDCSCQKEQEYFSATIIFVPVSGPYSEGSAVFSRGMPGGAAIAVATPGRVAAGGML